jgi:hypothetical protein
MRRILLDQGLAPHAAAILRYHGLDAVHVSEIGMERAASLLEAESLIENYRALRALNSY